ncbi:MAG TPA: arsenosugar biosynthesis radical SAM (seleno)protein ArsS [Usitatibacter sp.]|jgi:radical SAM/Cys-rich protein|nr:arsenosugar biosynthesis radical SAM (seleno)protein ArsS [Usitatibacter sp.]
MHATLPLLARTDFPPLARRTLDTVQVNVGYVCNQSCVHCHVNAGPTRTESMQAGTAADVAAYLAVSAARTLDLTGGAPELNPHFRELVRGARALGMEVIDRCNLTVMSEPGQAGLAAFLAAERVRVVASLPCYTPELVERQRGKGVYERSIEAILQLNTHGYGDESSGLELDLVYNPQGPSLPPPQAALESDYKRILGERFGIRFNRLLTLANMPIQRFGSMLVSTGQFVPYMALLRSAHRAENLDGVMCRSLVSVDWQGYVYDCDFNQMLGLPLRLAGRPRTHVTQLTARALDGNAIVVRDHCYGCTAGQGSSCGGALA